MKKFCPAIITLLLVLTLAIPLTVFAVTFTLDSIGTLSTEGNRYTEWWYSGENPVLAGTSTAGTEVTVSIDEEASSVTTAEDGTWSYTPTTLVDGTHDVVISTDEDSYAFSLRIGDEETEDTTTTTTETEDTPESTVPDTGAGQVFALLGSVVAISLGFYLLTNKKNASFIE
jgi:hypothetical protein